MSPLPCSYMFNKRPGKKGQGEVSVPLQNASFLEEKGFENILICRVLHEMSLRGSHLSSLSSNKQKGLMMRWTQRSSKLGVAGT